jgi:hypothetical protein
VQRAAAKIRRKPLEFPPEVGRTFVRDMEAYFAEGNVTNESAAVQNDLPCMSIHPFNFEAVLYGCARYWHLDRSIRADTEVGAGELTRGLIAWLIGYLQPSVVEHAGTLQTQLTAPCAPP